METATKFIMPGIIYVLTLATGIWLSSAGKPYPTAIFTVHKLIALAAVIVTAIPLYGNLKNTEIQLLLLAPLIVSGVCVVALFVTGALMSLGKPASELRLNVHKVAPLLAAAALAFTIYALAVRSV